MHFHQALSVTDRLPTCGERSSSVGVNLALGHTQHLHSSANPLAERRAAAQTPSPFPFLSQASRARTIRNTVHTDRHKPDDGKDGMGLKKMHQMWFSTVPAEFTFLYRSHKAEVPL